MEGRLERWKSVSDRQSPTCRRQVGPRPSARIYEPQMDETFQGAYAEAIKTGIKREPLPLRWLRI